jgi:glycosyltransferase involved in cell wall biosynthesis
MVAPLYVDATNGGRETHVQHLALGLQRRGHDVVIVRPAPQPPRRTDVVPPCVWVDLPWERRAARLTRYLPGSKLGTAVNRVCSNVVDLDRAAAAVPGPFDVVHHHGLLESYRVASGLSQRYGAAFVWTNHMTEALLLDRLPFGGRLLRRLTEPMDVVLGPSRDRLQVSGIGDRGVYSPNGVDAEVFTLPPDREALRAELGWSTGTTLLVPARWSPVKGLHVLAKALQSLHPFDGRVVFIGDRHTYPSYATQVRGLLEGVRVPLQYLDEVTHEQMARYYQAADLTLLPSLSEATSLAGLESMAAGTPVLGTRVGGIPEMIEHGVTGFLCEVDDPESLRRGIEEFVALDPLSREAVIAKARASVVESFSWEAVTSQVEKTYFSVLHA